MLEIYSAITNNDPAIPGNNIDTANKKINTRGQIRIYLVLGNILLIGETQNTKMGNTE